MNLRNKILLVIIVTLIIDIGIALGIYINTITAEELPIEDRPMELTMVLHVKDKVINMTPQFEDIRVGNYTVDLNINLNITVYMTNVTIIVFDVYLYIPEGTLYIYTNQTVGILEFKGLVQYDGYELEYLRLVVPR